MGIIQRLFGSDPPPNPRERRFASSPGSLVTTLNGRPAIDIAAVAENAIATGRAWDVFLQGNPAEYRQDVQATASASGALGYYRLVSPRFYDLCDEMREKCPPLDASLELITATILGREFRVEAPRDSGDAGAKIAAEVQRMIERPATIEGVDHSGDFGFDHLVSTALTGALLHGFAANEIAWNTGTGRGMIEPSHYLHCHPGQFVFDMTGGVKLYDGSSSPKDVPPGKIILTRLPGLYSNPYGRSAIFSLRYHYHFWRGILKAWVNSAAVYGTPLVLGKISADSADTDLQREASGLQAIIAGLREDVGAVLTQYQDIEIHDRMAGRGEPPHKALVEYFERAMIRRLLGAVLQVMEAEHGSRAQADTHAGVQTIRLKPLAALLGRSITRGLIAPIVRMNWGANAPIPDAVFDTDDAVDVEQIAKVLGIAEKAGFTASLDQIRDWTGLRAPADEADTLNPAATGKQIYQYHIVAGVTTINEIRQSLGLPPQDGGDVAVDPARFAIGEGDGAPVALSRAGAEEIVTLAASDVRRGRAKALAKFMDAVALEASRLDAAAVRAAIEKGLAKLAKDFPGDEALTVAAKNAALGVMDFSKLGAGLEVALGSAQAKAMIDTLAVVGKVVETVTPSDTAKATAAYKKAVDWMLDRKVMKAADVDRLAQAVTTLNPKLKAKDVTAAIRDKALALKDSMPLEVTVKIQRNLSAAINNGTTVNEFVQASRDAMGVSPDATVAGVDTYLENVYRTEISSAYSKQQEDNLSAPEVVDHLWGFEVHNPDDARSRPGHAGLDGMLVRLGSEAEKALGPTPFSYQCRCVKSPVIEVDPEKSKLKESPDAMARIARIERF